MPAETPMKGEYWKARVITSLSLLVMMSGLQAVFLLVRYFNSIPNTVQDYENFAPTIRLGMWLLLAALLLAAFIGACSHYRPVSRAGRLTIWVLLIGLVLSFVPFLGLLLPEPLLYLPAAFFVAVGVRSCLDAWRCKYAARTLLWVSPIAAAGFLAAITLSVVLGKLNALAWAHAFD